VPPVEEVAGIIILIFFVALSTPFTLCCLICPQKRLYQSVIDDVILNIKDTFLDEGVDEQVISKQL